MNIASRGARADYADWTGHTLRRNGLDLLAEFASDVIPGLEQMASGHHRVIP
jgi:hypothetical protein